LRSAERHNKNTPCTSTTPAVLSATIKHTLFPVVLPFRIVHYELRNGVEILSMHFMEVMRNLREI
jgi:hypothetical protein